MLSAWVTAIAQCPPADTTINDTALYRLPGQDGGVNLYCLPYNCSVNAQFDYSVDVTTSDTSAILVFGMEAVAAHVAIYDTTCTYRLWDTCGTWVYPDNIQLRDTFITGNKFRLVITPDGSGPDAVSYVQIHGFNTGRMLAPVQCDVTTIDPPTAGNTPPVYTEIHTFTSCSEFPNGSGVYVKWWPKEPWRKREKIVLLE